MKLRGIGGNAFDRDLFATVHHLREPFEGFAGYRPIEKKWRPVHPPAESRKEVTLTKHPAGVGGVGEAAGRLVTIKCVTGLKYDLTEIAARPGERLSMTLMNEDVISHNLVIVKPGAAERVGDAAAAMLTDPDALARHYVPVIDEVLWHTLVIDPGKSDSIHFDAPKKAGRYPYLCTFPGHWKIMTGVLVVGE